MDARCRVEMFGGLRLVQGSCLVTRFRTHNTAALLALLAIELPRSHARDALVELLWPDAEVQAGRAYLRTTLSYLRRLLEPPGVPYNHVLIADRLTVRLDPGAVTTDVGEFAAAREAAQRTNDPAEEIRLLSSAARLYTGDLLPGFFDEWALAVRQRFADAYIHTLKQLVRLFAEQHDYPAAIEYAQRILEAEPLDEQAGRALMRLYAATGAPNRAVALYEDLSRRLRDELGAPPSPELAALADKLRPLARSQMAGTVRELRESMEAPLPDPQPAAAREFGTMTRIPLIPTAFFGRAEELEALQRLLCGSAADPDAARLVTLTGPGGVGKTRLAIETGKRTSNAFGDAVCFVPLGDVAEPDQIAQAIASALRLPPIMSEDRFDQVVGFLNERPSLLILDNFEQLVEDGAEVVSALLRSAPNLTFLITSRRCLAIEGEQEFALGPLPIPESAASPEKMMDYAGIQLFADRARKVRPEFQVTSTNASDVTAVLRRLEGLPLALELAAARSRTLTPKQMRAYLTEGLDVLVNRRASKDARHRSLLAAMEWSYRLLRSAQRRAFARLSVFEGSWSLEAARAVLEDTDTEDMLDQLRIDSLIVAEEADGEMRYRMLNTLREFASARLGTEERRSTVARHAAHFARLVNAAMTALKGPDQARWLSRLDLDIDNIRAVFRHCVEDPEAIEDGLRLAAGMWRYWISRGLVSEGSAYAMTLVTRAGAELAGALYVDAVNAAGGLAFASDDYARCLSLHQEAARTARECGYEYGLGVALDDWGCVEIRRGNYAAASALLEESLAIHRRLDDGHGIAAALTHLGVALQQMEAFEEANRRYEEAADWFRRLDDQMQLATTLSNLGMIAHQSGEYSLAQSLYAESLEIHQSLGNRSGAALSIGNLGVLARTEGDFDTARRRLGECLATCKELGMRRAVGTVLRELGQTEERLGNMEAARKLYVESLEIQRSVGAKDGIIAALFHLGRVQIRTGATDEAAPRLMEALDLCMESGLHLAAASMLDQFAAIACYAGRLEDAAKLIGSAEKLRATGSASADDPDRDEVVSAIRGVMDTAAYAAAVSSGRNMPIADSVRLAHSLVL